MGQGNLIDINTIIDYIAESLPANAVQLIEAVQVKISVVTRIELLSWPNATPDDTTVLLGFISNCIVINLSELIILKTIEIRKKYKLKLGDAIIAATSILYELELYTRNLKDFDKIPELEIINPYLL